MGKWTIDLYFNINKMLLNHAEFRLCNLIRKNSYFLRFDFDVQGIKVQYKKVFKIISKV